MPRRLLLLLPALLISAGPWACDRTADGGLPPSYRRLVVPELVSSAVARDRGRELYGQHCALCHGERADGHGVRRPASSRPVDFTNPVWRRGTSQRRVFFTIREGVQGTAMPRWPLSDDETWDLVAYVLSVAEEGP